MTQAQKIDRVPGLGTKRSAASAYGSVVTCVATAGAKAETVGEQARLTFARVEKMLAELGSHKGLIMHIDVILGDFALKPEFDAEWNAWIGEDPAEWPSRCLIGATMSPGLLCEVVVHAVRPV